MLKAFPFLQWANFKTPMLTQLALWPVPSGLTLAAPSHRITRGAVLAVTRVRAVRSVSVGVTRTITLVPCPAHTTVTSPRCRITKGATVTGAALIAVVTVSTLRTGWRRIIQLSNQSIDKSYKNHSTFTT